MLSDPGNALAHSFGLAFRLSAELERLYRGTFRLDLDRFNGDDSWTLPMPARFVIGSEGTIIAADADPDYTVRPEPAVTVEILRSVADDRSSAAE